MEYNQPISGMVKYKLQVPLFCELLELMHGKFIQYDTNKHEIIFYLFKIYFFRILKNCTHNCQFHALPIMRCVKFMKS